MNPIISSVLTVTQTRLHDVVADVRWRSRFGTPPMTPDETSATSGDAVDELLLHSWNELCCGGMLRQNAAVSLRVATTAASRTKTRSQLEKKIL